MASPSASTRTTPMTKAVEVITSVQRRRRWSRAEKERIVAAALMPGAVASEVAREAGIHTSQLFRLAAGAVPAGSAAFVLAGGGIAGADSAAAACFARDRRRD